MKATLEFNLPEDAFEFKQAQQGCDWCAFVDSMNGWLRGVVKHGEADLRREAFQEVRTWMLEELNERGLSLE